MNKERARELAAAALMAGLNEQWPAATAALQAINDELGANGTEYACRAWCDTLVIRYQAATGMTDGDGTVIQPVWKDAETGEEFGADKAEPAARWAGQVIAARAAMDFDGYSALVSSLPADPQVIGDHVGTLLTMVATTLRALMAGAQ